MSVLDKMVDQGSKPSANDYVIPGDTTGKRITVSSTIKELRLLETNTSNLVAAVQSLPDGKDTFTTLETIVRFSNAIAASAKRLQEANR